MNKLSELQAEAKEDLIIIDDEDLHQQSYKNQIIKPKWLDYKSKYRMLMFQTKTQHKRLYREKWEYYGGKADAKVYAEKPFGGRISTQDKMKVYVESDDDVINLEAKIKYLDQMLYWLDQVMKQISNRGFQVKSAIEWEKFINGQ